MKKILAGIILSALFLSSVLPAFAASGGNPVVFFADLTSGPNTGGKDNNGVFVTVTGRNFGASRGTGTVSVGGGEAADYPVWTDTKITFQVGANAKSGDITVTTPGGASNGIRFTVRTGRIFFVDAKAPGDPGSGAYGDPWRSPRSFFEAQQAGDTCYFRAGTYSGKYGSQSRSYNVSYYNTGKSGGAPDNEVAWAGYPGETALFKADDDAVANGAFEFSSDNQHIVVAGLSIYGRGDGREQVRLYSDNLKLVNCRIEGIKTLSYAMVGVTASHLKIWGNEMTGARSGNKLDHIVYFQKSKGDITDVDIGWNHIHDNDIAVGPVFSWNREGQSSNDIRIHDNRIDCRESSEVLRLAGIWNGADGSITFANNLVIGAGGGLNNDNAYHAIYAAYGKIEVYNNTFYLSRGAGSNAVVNAYGSASAEVKNNIFHNEESIGYAQGNVRADSNLYYGGAGSAPKDDARAVTGDPLFVDPSGLDFHLRQGSPAAGSGTDVSQVVSRDYDGVPRAPGATCIGALQLSGSGAMGAPSFRAPSAGAPGVTVIGGSESRGSVNPGKGETAKIEFRGEAVGAFECRIFTVTGEEVWHSRQDNVESGTFEWVPGTVASGIYLVNVQGPGLKATKKLAVIE